MFNMENELPVLLELDVVDDFITEDECELLSSDSVDRAYYLFQYMHERVEDAVQYKDVRIHDDWHDLKKFREDLEDMPNYLSDYELDKDLLSPKGARIYSKETCCFLPREINQHLRRYGYVERHRRLPYTKHHISKGWYSTIKLNKDDEVTYFKTDIEAFLKSRETKHTHLVWLANKHKPQLPKYVYDELLTYKIGFDH